MGLDSLLAIQLQSDVESRFGKGSGTINIDEKTTFSDLYCALSGRDSHSRRAEANDAGHLVPDISNASFFQEKVAVKQDFDRMKLKYGVYSRQTEFEGFYSEVYPRQMELVVGYIVEAFSQLGCDLATLRAGERLPPVSYAPRYKKLVLQYHHLLEDMGLVSPSPSDDPSAHFRTAKALPHMESSSLLGTIIADFPAYRPDHELLQLTAPRLADCLSGKVDPLQLLFHSRASRQKLEAFYVHSPMFATATKMMSDCIGQLTRRLSDGSERLHVLEIGAGTGATASQVLEQLVASGADFTYTFTDISASLVAAARQKFEARYTTSRHRMAFQVLNIEQPLPTRLVNSQDLVIASNVLHATRSLPETCTNIRRLLRHEGGALCLLELTRPLPWLDCVFGLLEGWWRFDDSRTYPLVDERRWEACLLDAGFGRVDWTDDEKRESDLFRWILALT